MSIPTPFNPLGTLGAAPLGPSGYVAGGLVYWLDVPMDGVGALAELTELVGNAKVPCQWEGYDAPVAGADGVLRGYLSVPFGGFAAGPDYYVELVACATNQRFDVGAFADHYSENPAVTGLVPYVGLGNSSKMYVSRGAASEMDYTTYNYDIPDSRIGKVCTFAYGSATAVPFCENTVTSHMTNAYGAAGSHLLLWKDARFCALRIYSRVLTEAERAQNVARDAERWDKTAIIE